MTGWDHYKKTFVRMQALILAVTAVIFAWSRVPGVAAVFFVVMQSSALIGAGWGARLKNKIVREAKLAMPR